MKIQSVPGWRGRPGRHSAARIALATSVLGTCLLGLSVAAAGMACTGERTSQAAIDVSDPRSPGIWTSAQELAKRPTRGPAWEALLAKANQSVRRPNLADQEDPANVQVLAKAIVFARTGEARYASEVRRALDQVRGTEARASVLAIGRELMAYVIAADLVSLEGAERARFEDWLRVVSAREFQGRTLRSAHQDRPNNWGTHAGATRIAVAAYLGDVDEIERAAGVFKGWLGEPGGWRGFRFGNGSWQASYFRRYAVNPKGATLRGHSVDGVLPDDQRRGGGFAWPPPKENYVYEALQGATAQAVLLERLGYSSWGWGDRALLRAFSWLHEEANFPATGDDTWLPHLVNDAYQTSFPAPIPSQPGKGMGFTDWTHAPSAVVSGPE